MNRFEAMEIIRRLAAGIDEPTEGEAAARLLERVSKEEPEVRAVLLEAGALAVVRDELAFEAWTCQP